MPGPLTRSVLCGGLILLMASGTLLAHGLNVLVFTGGSTHASTPAGVAALQALGSEHISGISETSNAAVFTSLLTNHEVVIFLNSEGDVFNAAQEATFQSWYQSGGGVITIHAALETEPGWAWFGDLLGARSSGSSATTSARVEFLDQVHPLSDVTDPATTQRVIEWTTTDQWENFPVTPRGSVHVLAHVDERSYAGGTMGDDHPIVWCQEFDGSRSVYLGPGHEAAVFSDPIFLGLLDNSLGWVSGEYGGDSTATIHANFEKVILETNLDSPMSIDIAPNGDIYLIQRGGAILRHDQGTGVTTTLGTLDVHRGGEYGGLGIALAPDFETSENLYVLWSPNPATEPMTRLSRFTLDSSGNLDFASEVVVLEYYTDRDSVTGVPGHHQAGCLRFDGAGNLYISTGDNATHSGYSPRDTSNIGNDGRKGAPNSNDLRGKILRITPDVGGGPAAHPNYTIPAGNLFPSGTSLAREEIFVMGCRNPFRMCLDPHTGWLYYGDVGPDSGGTGGLAFEGPAGHDEFNQVKSAGWYGWPYYVADSKAYLDGSANPWTPATIQPDLASFFLEPTFTATPAAAGDPALLGTPEPAWIWYPDEWIPAPTEFSELEGSGGRCAMAGAVYQYEPGGNFPQYYDKSVFLMEWSRNEIHEVRTKPDGSLVEITEFAPNLTFSRPIEMKFGPDGAMYLIEWGSDFGSGVSADTALVKVQFLQSAATPVAMASADVTSGGSPLTVNFSSAGSFDPDGGTLSFEWDFDGDLVTDSSSADTTFTFTTPGTYPVRLKVTDDDLLFSYANLTISAGNHAPVVTFDAPGNNMFFDWGDLIDYSFSVADTEDGSSAGGQITGADVLFETSLGHEDHQHNELQRYALAGTVPVPRDDSHPFDANLAYVLDAFYADDGAPGVDPLTGTAKAVLQPKLKMAQNHDSQLGTETTTTSDPVGGGTDITSFDHGDYITFAGYNLSGISAIRLRAAVPGSGGNVEVRQDSPTGNLIATVPVTPTGGGYADFTGTLGSVLAGPHDLYLVATDTPGATDILRLNWINFRGPGATSTPNRPLVAGVSVPAPDTLALGFDQIMDFTTLADTTNYVLTGDASVVSATPSPDQQSVALVLAGLAPHSYHTITLHSLEDLAGDPIADETTVTAYYAAPGFSPFVFGLNAGGVDFTDGDGNLYLDDTATYATTADPFTNYYTPGTNSTIVANPIANTTDDYLYQSDRWADGGFTYTIPVTNGTYAVQLKFAETYFTFDGARTFNVEVEDSGNIFTPDLDLHATVGHDAAVDYLVEPVTVNDGALTIEFIDTGVDNPKVSAVGVWSISAGSSIPDPSFAVYLDDNPESLFNPFLDIDGDGLTALMEYALGGDDEVPDPSILPKIEPQGAGERELVFTRPVDLPDVAYRVVATASLATPAWTEVLPTESLTPLGGGLEEVRLQNLTAAASAAGITGTCYFRLEVSLVSPGM